MPAGPQSIATPRLRLDPLRVEDAVEMVDVLADPALYGFTGGEPPSAGELRRRYASQVAGGPPDGSATWRNWVARLAATGEAVGYVQATIVAGGAEADIAWVIGVAWQGHGYASEAAGALVAWLRLGGVGVVTAHIHPDHVASARVAERAGLTRSDAVEDGERVWRLVSDAAAP